jgi:hypothetical protein
MNDYQKDKEINLYKENYLLDSVFIKDTEFQYIFKKTEKIVTAIYLVTNFLVTEEPLKWSLRKSATSLLKSAMTFSRMSLSDREMRVHELNSSILETSSNFDLAFRSGFVSTMNYEVINFEISRLAASVAGYHSGSISSNKSLFDENYFDVQKDSTNDSSNVSNETPNNVFNNFSANSVIKDRNNNFIKDNNKGHDFYKGHKNLSYDTNKGRIGYETQTGSESNSNNISNETSAKKTSKTNSRTPRIKKTNSERRNIITTEIKKQGEVSVKDISKILPTLSEKTLQRELLAMVDDGILLKKGERRWSRYSIK